MSTKKNITIIGAGYVGMSLGALLGKKHKITFFDIDKKKVDLINQNKSSINDIDIDEYLAKNTINMYATLDKGAAYNANSDFFIISAPTNFNDDKNSFDTEILDTIFEDIHLNNKDPIIIIKSTIPVGYTDKVKVKYRNDKIIYSPEFLREGNSLKDNMYPSRIIIGSECQIGKDIGNIFLEISKNSNDNIMFMSSIEAESVKLFSNTYLAMRIAFFNELDSFALAHNIDPSNIINGMSFDKRIGSLYNNPSFGYGGYCLPKDSKQLESSYSNIPQEIISSIIKSNNTRKEFISNFIINLKPKTVGVFSIAMKKNSTNHRESAIIDVMRLLKKASIEVIVYDKYIDTSSLKDEFFFEDSIENFKLKSDLIITNRKSSLLNDVKEKVFTRDIFEIN